MLYELLNSHTLDYVMLGKFQTDNLESRFGQYRQLSGCNYLVSVAEVMQGEVIKNQRIIEIVCIFWSCQHKNIP